MEPFLAGDDHIEQYQIYSNQKELQKKLCIIALKRKFQARKIKSSTKILLVYCVDKECKWKFRVTKLGNSDFFEIRFYNSIHL